MNDEVPCPGVSRRRFLAQVGAGMAACSFGGACRAAPSAPTEPKEALFYERLDGQAVRCGLCPRACVVPEGRRGYCDVRENRAGRYYSLVYGYPCSRNLDPIEKKPFFHVYPGSKSYSLATVGCNIECKFCQNWEISQAKPEDVNPRIPYTPPAAIARAAADAGARTVAFTYSEPTIFYEYMLDCAKAARDAGLGSVVVSNGFIAKAPQEALFPHVTAAKIDLKAFTGEFYRNVCDGLLEPVLESLKRLAGSGVWYEIVVLLIPTLNDAPDEIRRMAAWIVANLGPDVPVHFSRYHPQYKMRNIPPTPVETLRRARETAIAEGCRFVYLGNVPGEEGQHTYCPACKRVVVKRYGHLIESVDLKDGHCTHCAAPIPGLWR